MGASDCGAGGSGDERVAARYRWEGVAARVGAAARSGLTASAPAGAHWGSRCTREASLEEGKSWTRRARRRWRREAVVGRAGK